MPDLQDDIARIAALRGRTAADYVAPRVSISTHELGSLLIMRPDPAGDLEAIDEMSAASREIVTTWERPINAQAWLSLADRYGEEVLIRIFRAWYADVHGHAGDGPRRKPRRRYS